MEMAKENLCDVKLDVTLDEYLTYALIHNGENFIREITIKNKQEIPLESIVLKITSNNRLIESFERTIQFIDAGETIDLKDIEMKVDIDGLVSLTERMVATLTIAVVANAEELVVDQKDLFILPFDHWPGLQYTPELLTSYVLPNHPVVANVLQKASTFLKDWTQNPSLAGYQYDDPTRVKYMAAAAFAALQEQNITYVEPPASFESYGQRIRLADTVMDQHMGTCIDLTLLYAACLEAMGLNPFLVMMKGHIFAGVWLIDKTFSEMITDDPTQLEKRMSTGIYELIVVECTNMCAGTNYRFDEAIQNAQNHVANYGSFEFVIDVKRARSFGIRPLPVRMKEGNSFVVIHEERKKEEITSAPEAVGQIFDLSDMNEKEVVTKQMQWERKLLDLNMRNLLINFRVTTSVLPLLTSNISVLEDALADGEEFRVLPRPEDIKIDTDNKQVIENLTRINAVKDYIDLESKQKKLHSVYTEAELEKRLTKLYRSAKSSMEENGASTLYLALGLLKWFDVKTPSTPRYAPLVMIPVEIKRKSAGRGYGMHMRDDDVQMNVTLLEFLKQNHNIQIQGLNPLPMDDHGVDLPRIFSIISDSIMELPQWKVVEVAVIGNFTFSQFVMWNDICDQDEFLENNPIVRSLMNGAIDWDCRIQESEETDEAYLPVSVDASQLRAINLAANGVSFVLHGPPGTGKSQTITAMIANALAKGKTVLFVAEKMAALEVVQRRLEALGLSDFCLELHSNKSTKKAVLRQLQRSMEIDVDESRRVYETKLNELHAVKDELDAYAKALHVKRQSGKSLRELLDIYEGIQEHDVEVLFSNEYLEQLTDELMSETLYCLRQLVVAGKGVGHPHNHPLSAICLDEYNQRLKRDLNPFVDQLKQELQQCMVDASSFQQLVGIESLMTKEDYQELLRCSNSILGLTYIPDFLYHATSLDEEFYIPFQYLDHKMEFEQKQEQMLESWDETFLKMDMASYRTRYDKAASRFLLKNKALGNVLSELQQYAKEELDVSKIPMYINEILAFQKEVAEFEEATKGLPFAWIELLKKYPTKEDLQVYKTTVKKDLNAVRIYRAQLDVLEQQGKMQGLQTMAKQVLEDFEKLEQQEQKVMDLLALKYPKTNTNWLQNKIDVCDSILRGESEIKEWVTYRQCESACIQKGLHKICDAYASGIEHDALVDIYLKSVYRAMIISIIDQEASLNHFNGTVFNEKIRHFKQMDEQIKELTKQEVYCELSQQLPSDSDSIQISKELNILRKATRSNGRAMSIRSLFEQIPTILPKLCPCMLMSPISVAQYLSTENDLFDIVIFDEASQLPTCKAVGVLARGKNAVIVGDPNQMPPTSFFAGNKLDEDNLEIEDLDSILDDCLALGMPQTHLHWHYRSRHESLIDFSNNEFYESSMFTFPSANDGEKKVSLRKVDGYFERGRARVNRAEAEEIVKEIKRRYKSQEYQDQTIGVVTFNVTQQNLIEDLLQAEYMKDAQFDLWANYGEEPLFVKNLENVQGDERDVILFSVAYGPDAEGKLSLNFGPLNKQNGWKRLNVAVTRARNEMVVFATLTPDQINLRRTKARGVEALKNFLEYADKGRVDESAYHVRKHGKQGISEQICEYLKEHGYAYQRAVGNSKFKIDIAVVSPLNKDQYILGIMLDDSSYSQTENTRDREIGQISVLKGLGWTLRRIWAIDWWDNKDKELANLNQQLEELIAQEKTKEESDCEEDTDDCLEVQDEDYETEFEESQSFGDDEDEETSIEPIERIASATLQNFEPSSADYLYKDYTFASIDRDPMDKEEFSDESSEWIIAMDLEEIIEVEAPIRFEELQRRILHTYGIYRMSAMTTSAIEKTLEYISANVIEQNGVRFIWREDQDPRTYCDVRCPDDLELRREIEDICVEEVKNAVCIALRDNGPLDRNTLIRQAIYLLGFARIGKALKDRVNQAITYGLQSGELEENEWGLFILSNS